MRRALLALAVLAPLVACGVPDPPKPPGGVGVGGGEDDTAEDTDEPCGTCTLYDCVDLDEPDVRDEAECEAAADDQGCDDWEWDAC